MEGLHSHTLYSLSARRDTTNVFGSTGESFRNRFSEELESSVFEAALRDVRANCSEETYEAVRGCIVSSKGRETE